MHPPSKTMQIPSHYIAINIESVHFPTVSWKLSLFRSLLTVVGSGIFGVFACPIVAISNLFSCLPLTFFLNTHTTLISFLWQTTWTLIQFISHDEYKPPSQCVLFSNAKYSLVVFGLVSWFDVVLAIGPTSLIMLSVIAFSTMDSSLSTWRLVIQAGVGTISLLFTFLLARFIARYVYLPLKLAVAFPHSSVLMQHPSTPCTPRDLESNYTASTPYELDAKLNNTLEQTTSDGPSLFGALTQWFAQRAQEFAKRLQGACNTTVPAEYLSTQSSDGDLSSSDCESSTSSHSPNSVTSTESPRPSVSLDVNACATLIQRNFQRRLQGRRRIRQPDRRNLGGDFLLTPSAPSPERLLHNPLPSKHLAPLQTRQMVPRPSSLSSSDEEDFQLLCDSVLKRKPLKGDAAQYDQMSPRFHATTKPPSRPVSRGLHGSFPADDDEKPSFTAFAPRRIAANTSFHLIIACHVADEGKEVHGFIAAAGARPVTRTLTLDNILPRDTRVTISIEVPSGFQVLSPSLHQTFAWRAGIDAIDFHLFAEGILHEAPYTIPVKVVALDYVGVLQCCIVVGPSGVSKQQQCEDEWYRIEPVCKTLELLECGFKEIPYNELKISKWIDHGHFGDAFLAEYDGKQVVVKTLRQHDIPALQHEAAVLSKFGQHPCIVPFVGACTKDDAPLAVVTEYMPLGSLSSLMATSHASVQYPSSIRTGMLCDAANGLAHLHDSQFLHRDVAARNCFVDTNHRVKVGDFGLARRGYVVESAAPIVGPLKWMAPEMLQPPYVSSQSSDVFAFGITMWEVYHGEAPYKNLDPMQVAVRVCEGDRLPLNGTLVPSKRVDLMGRCFNPNPDKRPSMVEIYNELNR